MCMMKEKHLHFTPPPSPRSYTAQVTEIQLPLMKFLVGFCGLVCKKKGRESGTNMLVFLNEIY